MKKCHDKYLNYIVPRLRCSFCHNRIRQGESIYTVVLTWGNGRTACKECYDEYEINYHIPSINEKQEKFIKEDEFKT